MKFHNKDTKNTKTHKEFNWTGLASRTFVFFVSLFLNFFILLFAAPPSAFAKIERLTSQVNRSTIDAGDSFTLTVIAESDDSAPQTEPSAPDFGGLSLVGKPMLVQHSTWVNGRASFALVVTYTLTAARPGDYTIGPTQVRSEGNILQTNPIQIHVAPAAVNAALPQALKNETILNPRADDPGIAEQLKGKLFIRPVVSKGNPFVGEPVVVSYYLYIDSTLADKVRLYTPPPLDTKGMLTEIVYQLSNNLNASVQNLDGRSYHSALLYQAALTPIQPGGLTLDGYAIRLAVMVSRRSRLNDPFEPLFDPSVNVDVPAAPIELNVRPLPTAGQPASFSGTVGTYTVEATLDRDHATRDDVVSLTLTLSGRGNIASAAMPQFPEQSDFELFDPSQKVEKSSTGQGMTGRKIFRFPLRPKKTGKLTIPVVQYPIFDPEKEAYTTLASPPREVVITARPGEALTAEAESNSPEGADRPVGLRYIKPHINTAAVRPVPLVESSFYWAAQAGAIAMAGLMAFRARRRDQRDPAQIRKSAARASFEKKLAALGGSAIEERDLTGGAAALERAIREFVADRHNLSPEGLTSDEIGFRLRKDGFSEQGISTVLRLLNLCSMVRYAPAGTSGPALERWVAEAQAALKEFPE